MITWTFNFALQALLALWFRLIALDFLELSARRQTVIEEDVPRSDTLDTQLEAYCVSISHTRRLGTYLLIETPLPRNGP
jgi:hypothetical protein